MSDTSLSALGRINAACDRFVEAWLAGQRPRVADFLRDAPEGDRPELRDALLGEAVFRIQGSDTGASTIGTQRAEDEGVRRGSRHRHQPSQRDRPRPCGERGAVVTKRVGRKSLPSTIERAG
jgi:hypothetical protein